MPIRRRLLWSLIGSLLSFLIVNLYWKIVTSHGNDFSLPLCMSQALLSGIDPYGGICSIPYNGAPSATYPLTTLVALLPLASLTNPLSSFLLWSISTGLLVFGILSGKHRWQLLIFTAAAYWQALRWLQFSPLLAAVAMLPSLAPLGLLKPQLGLPIIVTRLTSRRIVAVLAFSALTFVIYPDWPLHWWTQAVHYDGLIPLFVLPGGIFLLLVLVRWREPNAWLLALMAAMPQRGLYDTTALWLAVQSPRQLLVLSGLSWLAAGLSYYFNLYSNGTRSGVEMDVAFTTLLVYMPLALMIIDPMPRIRKLDRSITHYIHSSLRMAKDGQANDANTLC